VTRRRPPRYCALALVVTVAALGACGSDDADGDAVGADADPAEARVDVEVGHVDAGLRITWTVTNDGDTPLLVFDNLRGDEQPGHPVQGAFVTGGDGRPARGAGVVEVSRRVFPVPADVEGVQVPTVTAVELAPGASATATENVPLPFAYRPAAPRGGGEPLPGAARSAVFCIGVGPAAGLDASPLAAAPGRWSVRHSEANAAQQTLLCSDPFDIDG
jgi:hypothetical protein